MTHGSDGLDRSFSLPRLCNLSRHHDKKREPEESSKGFMMMVYVPAKGRLSNH